MKKTYPLVQKTYTKEEYQDLKVSVFKEIVEDFKEFQKIYLESLNLPTEVVPDSVEVSLKTKGTYSMSEQSLISMQVAFELKKPIKDKELDELPKPSFNDVQTAKSELERIRKQRELNFV